MVRRQRFLFFWVTMFPGSGPNLLRCVRRERGVWKWGEYKGGLSRTRKFSVKSFRANCAFMTNSPPAMRIKKYQCMRACVCVCARLLTCLLRGEWVNVRVGLYACRLRLSAPSIRSTYFFKFNFRYFLINTNGVHISYPQAVPHQRRLYLPERTFWQAMSKFPNR